MQTIKRHSSIQYFTTNKSVLVSCWLCIGCNTKNLIFPYSKWNNSKTVNWLFHLMNTPSIWKLIVMLLVLWCILAQLADNEKKKKRALPSVGPVIFTKTFPRDQMQCIFDNLVMIHISMPQPEVVNWRYAPMEYHTVFICLFIFTLMIFCPSDKI